MLPNVFKLLHDSVLVAGMVGDRIFRHGDAAQDVPVPYITWSVLSSAPENNLSDLPPTDAVTVLVNCWHGPTDGSSDDSDTEVERLGGYVRDAIEQEHHITQGPSTSRDPETMRYRVTIIFTFWNPREAAS